MGGRAFHELKCGEVFPTDGDVQHFADCVVSFDRNISIYADDVTHLQSAPSKDWRPLPLPVRPAFVMAVGDSPFARYGGMGIYTLKLDYAERKGELIVNPNAEVVGGPGNRTPRRARSC